MKWVFSNLIAVALSAPAILKYVLGAGLTALTLPRLKAEFIVTTLSGLICVLTGHPKCGYICLLIYIGMYVSDLIKERL